MCPLRCPCVTCQVCVCVCVSRVVFVCVQFKREKVRQGLWHTPATSHIHTYTHNTHTHTYTYTDEKHARYKQLCTWMADMSNLLNMLINSLTLHYFIFLQKVLFPLYYSRSKSRLYYFWSCNTMKHLDSKKNALTCVSCHCNILLKCSGLTWLCRKHNNKKSSVHSVGLVPELHPWFKIKNVLERAGLKN